MYVEQLYIDSRNNMKHLTVVTVVFGLVASSLAVFKTRKFQKTFFRISRPSRGTYKTLFTFCRIWNLSIAIKFEYHVLEEIL